MSYEPSDAKSLFLRAAELSDSAERAAFLAGACDGKPELRARVENLLKAASDPDSLIDGPLGEFAATQMDNRGESEVLQEYIENDSNPESPLQLGGYKVLEVIGRGGMGIVLRALDEKLNRVVAIKVLASGLARQPQARKRFLREAQAAAAVSHDHVVTIHAVDDGSGGSNNIPLLVMECVVGQSLQQKIDKVGALSVKEILRIGMQIASGLAAAHQQGLVHRDIKPSNILLENGIERVKITDFGLARATDDVGITVSGQIAGTPQYMSPEQATGQPVDQRSDLFSLGSVLYTMCTGRPAFRADSAVAVLRRVCDDTPRAINEVNVEIPDWLVSIVDRLMSKKKEDRFQNAREVAVLLENWLAHVQQPDSVPRPMTDPLRISTRKSVVPGSVLRLAWKDWWSQRDHWITIGVQTVLILAYLICMVCFVSFRLSSGIDSDGQATFDYRLGVPSPWFKFEVYPESLVPFRSAFHLWSSSVLLGVIGCVVFYIYWRIEKVRAPNSSNWGGPRIMLGIWGIGAVCAVGLGHWMGFDALNKPRITVMKSNLEPAKAGTTTQDHEALQPKAEAPQSRQPAPPAATAPFDAAQARHHQEAWAQFQGVPVEITNSVGMKLQLIPPGKFQMGSTSEELAKLKQELEQHGASDFDKFIAQSSGPKHVVEISQPFYMSQHEVTVALYRQFVEEVNYQSSADKAGDARFSWKDFVSESDAAMQPVCGISWEDASAFCEWLCAKTTNPAAMDSAGSSNYSLPTESQWEFACRAGSETLWSFGETDETLNEYAIIGQTRTPYPAAIGLRRANPFGLFDMHGNVDEWCLDWHSTEYYGRSPLIDPVCSEKPRDPASGRVSRGGAWNSEPWRSRSATRSYDFPASPTFAKGFRVVSRLP